MTEEAKTEEAKTEKDTANGVTRPKAGTKTGRVWEIADALSEAAGEPAARKDVLADAQKEDINPATAATQYGRWRKYHGLGKEAPAKAEAGEEPEVETEEE